MKKSSKCLASVILVKDGERWWPKDISGVEDHNHMDESGDILKKDIYERVKADPHILDDTVYRTVVTEYAENHEGVWDKRLILDFGWRHKRYEIGFYIAPQSKHEKYG